MEDGWERDADVIIMMYVRDRSLIACNNPPEAHPHLPDAEQEAAKGAERMRQDKFKAEKEAAERAERERQAKMKAEKEAAEREAAAERERQAKLKAAKKEAALISKCLMVSLS